MKLNKTYICETEDKIKKIYYDVDEHTFGSIRKEEQIVSQSIVVFLSIVSYVLARPLSKYILPKDLTYLGFISMLLGLSLGGLCIFIMYKLKAPLVLENEKYSSKEIKEFIELGLAQLEKQKAFLFFLILLNIALTGIFFFRRDILSLFLTAFLWFIVVVFFHFADIFGRKKIYSFLEKM